jgi:hypothetical protein
MRRSNVLNLSVQLVFLGFAAINSRAEDKLFCNVDTNVLVVIRLGKLKVGKTKMTLFLKNRTRKRQAER